MVAGAALVALLGRSDLLAAIEVMSNVALEPMLVALGLSGIAILNRAAQYRAAHRALGLDAGLLQMAKVSAAAYALNKVVKTGGLGGMALFVRHGSHRGYPAGTVIASCVVHSVAGHAVFLTMLGTVLGWLAATGSLTRSWSLAAGGVALVIVAVVVGALAMLRRRSAVERWFARPFELAGKVAARFGLTCPGPPDRSHIDRFYEAAGTIRRDPKASLPIFAHAVVGKLLGATVLIAALRAVGSEVGLVPAMLVYALALIAAASTVLPGGFGVVEATMTVLLAGYGVSTPTAIAAIAVFRLLDMWLPVIVGLLLAPGLREPTSASQGRQVEVGGSSDLRPESPILSPAR